MDSNVPQSGGTYAVQTLLADPKLLGLMAIALLGVLFLAARLEPSGRYDLALISTFFAVILGGLLFIAMKGLAPPRRVLAFGAFIACGVAGQFVIVRYGLLDEIKLRWRLPLNNRMVVGYFVMLGLFLASGFALFLLGASR